MNIDAIKNLDPEFKATVMGVMPESVSGFISAIGFEATIALVMELGGTEFNVPATRNSKYFSVLAEAIGEEAALSLSLEYRSEGVVYIPMCTKGMALIRNRQIIADYNELLRQGESARTSANQLARKNKMNYRAIEEIVNKNF